MKKPYERLMEYCRVNTMSDETVETSPTTKVQFDLANLLLKELEELGVSNLQLDETCVLYGEIPATPGQEKAPAIGFIAHLDTVPDFPGEEVKPLVHENYDGEDIKLPLCDRVISVSDFPHLKEMKGKTVITASGDTVLGSDDKAGVAEIVCLCERLLTGDIPHGKVCIAFTPDEEVGLGTSNFDIPRFGADFAYTLDGGRAGEVVYENFNAASAVFTVEGVNVHPGSAKNIMVNASLVAMEINSMLPACETPAHTEGYEGFYHLISMEGSVDKATLTYIVRDHDGSKLDHRVDTLRHIEKIMQEKYGDKVNLKIRMGYRNMAEKVKTRMEIVEAALRATEKAGLIPSTDPIRGGTDGANLTAEGLPCPNLGTGSYGFHGPYEHSVAEDMELCVDMMEGILKEFCV
ncbi:MAG: peptidase T [Ruminococcaceae bacterium]|nr:peptidase T [Oscillospiraceae bacterium]